ncbi:MAG: hypothetical protein DHS20C11_07750 [Lysobacteraceae bacterium]|nr:MAG: hypothetical protein DHS20C11_07750 [Xanthomonadaceae bacterium]
MRETIFILALVMVVGVNAQESGDDSDEVVEEATGPSWRDGRPTRPSVPGAPEVERPNFEFKMERPTLDLSTEFEGFKPKVAVQEVEDVPEEPATEEAEAPVEVPAVAESQSAPPVSDQAAPAATDPEPVVEQPAVATIETPVVEQESPAANEFIAEQSVVENRPVASPDELIGQPTEPEQDAAPTQIAAATPPAETVSIPQTNRTTTRARLVPSTMVEPEYPLDAWRDNKEGWVDVRLVVNGDGAVVDAEAVRAEPRRVFDRSAIRAAMQWRFEPVDGLGVSETVSRTYRVSFTMDEQ